MVRELDVSDRMVKEAYRKGGTEWASEGTQCRGYAHRGAAGQQSPVRRRAWEWWWGQEGKGGTEGMSKDLDMLGVTGLLDIQEEKPSRQ